MSGLLRLHDRTAGSKPFDLADLPALIARELA
jgi:hypothetical protein